MKHEFINKIIVIVALVGVLWAFSSAKTKLGGEIVVDVELKTDVANILDSHEYVEDGVTYVQYAYKTDPIVLEQNEIARTETGFTKQLGENTYELISYSGTNFYKDNGVWKQVEYATTTKAVFDSHVSSPIAWLIKIAYAVDIFSGAGDGGIEEDTGASSTWDIAHDALTGTIALPVATDIFVGSAEASFATADFIIDRGFLPFYTNSIPSGASISSATVSLFVFDKGNTDNDADDWINFVQTSQPSSVTLTTADYDLAGAVDNPTEGATRIDIGSITSGARNVWTLDATGLSWIKKQGQTSNCGSVAGYTCLGFREGHDAIDSAMTTNTLNYIDVYSVEQAGTSQDPFLSVVYTLPTKNNVLLINGANGIVNGANLIVQ